MLERLKQLLRGKPKVQLPPRSGGLADEVAFWRQWFITKGGQWPDDYARRFDASLALQDELASIARAHPSATIDILDVGAGPVTRLGKSLADKTIRLTPTDYLANEYNALIDELGAVPLVRTQFADAERLVERFGERAFDIVHAQNCVDHMVNAMAAIEQMIAVLRPRGVLYLRHEENEGRHAGYKTIHHWDFSLDDAHGRFTIKHVNAAPIDVSARVQDKGSSRAYREGKRVVFEFTKR